MGKVTTAAVVLGAGALPFGSAGMVSSHIPSSRLECAVKKEIDNPHEIPDTFNPQILPPIYKAFGEQYKTEILTAAKKYDVPPEYIIAAIVEENYGRHLSDDILDNLALACGKIFPNKYGIEYNGKFVDSCFDPSLGIGQIRRSVGKKLVKKYDKKQLDISALTTQLQDTARNIDYTAMVFADLTHPPNSRPPQGNYFDAHYTAIVGTRYVKGPTDTLIPDARPSCEGMYFVYYLSNFPSITVFGKAEGRITERQQNELRKYAKEHLPRLCKEPSSTQKFEAALAKI